MDVSSPSGTAAFSLRFSQTLISSLQALNKQDSVRDIKGFVCVSNDDGTDGSFYGGRLGPGYSTYAGREPFLSILHVK